MQFLRNKTEAFFGWWSAFVVRHPWWILGFMLAWTAVVVPQLKNTTVDFSTEAFLPGHDKAVTDYDQFRFEFGQAGFGLVIIETPNDVFTLENLQKIKALQEDIEQHVPHIEEITSLVSVRHTSGDQGGLVIKDLYELWPHSQAELPAFKKMVMENPTYVGNMVSASGRITSLIIKVSNYTSETDDAEEIEDLLEGFDAEEQAELGSEGVQKRLQFLKPEEETDFAKALIKVAAQHESAGFKVHATGMPVINYLMAIDLGESMSRDTAIGVVVLAVLLALLFQRLSGVLLPLTVVFLSLLVSLAFMPILDFPFMGTAQILPMFLLAVGIADSMHILSVFYREYDEGTDKHEAIVHAVQMTSVAVLMTSITTAAGLLSFAFADLRPTQMLGIFGSLGVMLALIYTLVLVPALLAVCPIKRRFVQKKQRGIANAVLALADRLVYGISQFGLRHAKGVFAFAIVLALVSAVGMSKIYFSHDPVRWYPVDHPTRVASELTDTELSGAVTLEILLDSGVENGLYDPQLLQLIERIEQLAMDFENGVQDIKDTVSILEVVKENHKILHADDPAYYVIPDTREEIAQELLLFENSGSDDLEEFTDTTFRKARITAMMPYQNVYGMKEYLEALKSEIQRLIDESGLQGVTFEMTGLLVIFAKVLLVMLFTTISSYGQSFLLVGVLMILLMGTIKKGALAFAPNMIPVVFTLGLMGWIGMPLDVLTSTIGCIIIGIAVDDTIHFMHHYRSYIEKYNDPDRAVMASLNVAGRAILFTTIVLVGCFLVHTTDTFITSRNFGILLSFSLAVALVSNLLIAPALLKLFWNEASK